MLLYKKLYIILDIIVMHMIWKFCSLVKTEKTQRPGFYAKLVTTDFSNFPQLKQLNKIKNTCEYFDPLKLWTAWFRDPR